MLSVFGRRLYYIKPVWVDKHDGRFVEGSRGQSDRVFAEEPDDDKYAFRDQGVNNKL